jgi:hypothetical protein
MADDKRAAVFRFDPARISQHEARRRMKAFLASLEAEDEETGERIIGTRTVEVTIPDVPIVELDWPEAIMLSLFAFGTPFPIASEYATQEDFSAEAEEAGTQATPV